MSRTERTEILSW